MKGTRREFLGRSAKLIASGIVGSSVLNAIAQAESKPTTSQPANTNVELRPLGRTGLKISVISVGSIGTTENVVRYALDNGINFVHTSIQYGNGKDIREVGKGIKGRANKVYLGLKVTWKWNTDNDLNKSLKLLGRDYVDVIFFQIHNNPALVASPEAKETFERWKKQGKVRFMGLTSHGGMKECMKSALATGWYDCLMPAYDLSMRDDFLEIFLKCEKQKVGIVAMKTKISEDNTSPIPVMLKDKALTTICKSLRTLNDVKKYLEAAREKITDADTLRTMNNFALSRIGRCTMCGTCTAACPNGLAVNDIVRSVDYYVDTMQDLDAGRMNYEFIDRNCNADRCADCGKCEKACPNRVPVRSFIERSRKIFV